MNLRHFDTFCKSLPHTTHVVQWGGAHVWKVGGKLFAVAWEQADGGLHVTFKTSDITYEILKEQAGCRPAPYLASRGMKWIQRTGAAVLDDDGLEIYLRESHRLVTLNLTKKKRAELGLDWQPVPRSLGT